MPGVSSLIEISLAPGPDESNYYKYVERQESNLDDSQQGRKYVECGYMGLALRVECGHKIISDIFSLGIPWKLIKYKP